MCHEYALCKFCLKIIVALMATCKGEIIFFAVSTKKALPGTDLILAMFAIVYAR